VVSGRRRRVDDRRAVDDRWTGHRSADECTSDNAGANDPPAGTAPAAAAALTRTAAAPPRTAAPTAYGQDVARRGVLQGQRTGQRSRRGAINGHRYTCSQHRRGREKRYIFLHLVFPRCCAPKTE
jgi:hypothetical protein